MAQISNFSGNKAAAREKWRAWRAKDRTEPARAARSVKGLVGADGVPEILVYDDLGPFGLTSKAFAEALSAITGPAVRVRVDSFGGDVFAGIAIHNALKGFNGSVEVVVDGIAASAASVVAMAGHTIAMHESAMMMLHRAWAVAIGNAVDMRDTADALDKIDGQLAAIYANQTGKTAGEMAKLMEGEADGTWFTAAEAVDIGLADELLADGSAAARARASLEADAFTIADAERALRSAGATRGMAKAIVQRGFRDAPSASLADELQAAAASLRSFNERKNT